MEKAASACYFCGREIQDEDKDVYGLMVWDMESGNAVTSVLTHDSCFENLSIKPEGK